MRETNDHGFLIPYLGFPMSEDAWQGPWTMKKDPYEYVAYCNLDGPMKYVDGHPFLFNLEIRTVFWLRPPVLISSFPKRAFPWWELQNITLITQSGSMPALNLRSACRSRVAIVSLSHGGHSPPENAY